MVTMMKVSKENNKEIQKFVKEYNLRSADSFLEKVINYINYNNIDLNVNLREQNYFAIKDLEKNFQKDLNQKSKRIEHLITILYSLEREYFYPMKEMGMLEYNTEREIKEDLIHKEVLQNVIEKITPVYSEKRKKDVYIFDVEEAEYKRLLNYAR